MEKYKIVNGTSYHTETPDAVINVLENCRQSKKGYRIIVEYGDVKTGQGWGDTYGVSGYVGRSTGRISIPIFVYNNRSTGGQAILDQCIVNIVAAKGKKVLYCHPDFKTGIK